MEIMITIVFNPSTIEQLLKVEDSWQEISSGGMMKTYWLFFRNSNFKNKIRSNMKTNFNFKNKIRSNMKTNFVFLIVKG